MRDRFDRIRERLLRGGVAPRHVRRTILELQTHYADLVTELQSNGHSQAEGEAQAAVRLGSDDVLIASVLVRPELRSWSRRWPWLAFAVLPVVGLVAAFVLSCAILAETLQFTEHHLGWMPATSPFAQWIKTAIRLNKYLVPSIVAGVVCLEAARRRAPVGWAIAGTILVGFLGSLTNLDLDWSVAHPRGELSGGVGIGTDAAVMLGIFSRVCVTAALTLIPYFWWRRTHEPAQ
jgi:hypothetical protein